MKSFEIAFFTNEYFGYYQLLILCVLLTVVMLVSLFSETIIISYGAYIFVGSLISNFMLSFFTDNYRYFILHWFLASIGFFIFWCVLIYICSRYGKPYNGDGGMIILLPAYFLPLLIFISVLLKFVKILIQRL
jgi:hypothetical protein